MKIAIQLESLDPKYVLPSGSEVLISGQSSEFNWVSGIDLSPLSESVYVDMLSVLHSSDAGVTWELIPGASWSYPNIPDNYMFQVPEVDTISFRNKFKVEVLDIGDYMGVNQVFHSDISEHLIVIANDELENSFSSGWNIVSSPLALPSASIDDIFDVENYCFELFDQDGVVIAVQRPHLLKLSFKLLVGIIWFLKMRSS